MSSNIKIQRICKYCSNEFTARTTVTQYCGDNCAKRAYKARKRTSKIDVSIKQTEAIKAKPIELLKAKEFLTVKDVSILLCCSIRTAYRLINKGNINAVNISERKTLVKRSDIDILFQPLQSTDEQQVEKVVQPIQISIADCYNLSEIQNKYGISGKALNDIIKRNNISKIKEGRFTYVPMIYIDQIFK